MGFLDKARGAAENALEKAAPHLDKAKEKAGPMVEKAAGKVDEATGGKYSQQLSLIHI